MQLRSTIFFAVAAAVLPALSRPVVPLPFGADGFDPRIGVPFVNGAIAPVPPASGGSVAFGKRLNDEITFFPSFEGGIGATLGKRILDPICSGLEGPIPDSCLNSPDPSNTGILELRDLAKRLLDPVCSGLEGPIPDSCFNSPDPSNTGILELRDLAKRILDPVCSGLEGPIPNFCLNSPDPSNTGILELRDLAKRLLDPVCSGLEGPIPNFCLNSPDPSNAGILQLRNVAARALKAKRIVDPACSGPPDSVPASCNDFAPLPSFNGFTPLDLKRRAARQLIARMLQ